MEWEEYTAAANAAGIGRQDHDDDEADDGGVGGGGDRQHHNHKKVFTATWLQ